MELFLLIFTDIGQVTVVLQSLGNPDPPCLTKIQEPCIGSDTSHFQ